MVIDDLVSTVLEALRTISQTETVVGEPITLEGITLVPVSRISVGFGVGGGMKEGKGGQGEATGGGVTIEPVAFFVVHGDKVELVTVQKSKTGLGTVIDLLPQIVEKVKDFKHKKEKPSASNQKDSE